MDNDRLNLNFENLIERMGDSEISYLVLFHFRNQLEEDLIKIQELIESNDFDELYESFHGLKGAAGATAAENIFDIMVKMEESCKSKNMTEIKILNQQLNTFANNFLKELNLVDGFVEIYGKK